MAGESKGLVAVQISQCQLLNQKAYWPGKGWRGRNAIRLIEVACVFTGKGITGRFFWIFLILKLRSQKSLFTIRKTEMGTWMIYLVKSDSWSWCGSWFQGHEFKPHIGLHVGCGAYLKEGRKEGREEILYHCCIWMEPLWIGKSKVALVGTRISYIRLVRLTSY